VRTDRRRLTTRFIRKHRAFGSLEGGGSCDVGFEGRVVCGVSIPNEQDSESERAMIFCFWREAFIIPPYRQCRRTVYREDSSCGGVFLIHSALCIGSE
jgi:hypothetical protein